MTRARLATWAGRLRMAALILTAVLAGCARTSTPPAPLHVTLAPEGPDTRITLHAAPHLKINARLAPALELAGGTRVRFATGRLTPDSAYFAEPPSARLAGRHDQVHGTLHVSVCEEHQQVCRSVTVEI